MNDERPIEELLRRAVRERNAAAGAALELHPLHRRQLQAEVARQFPTASAAPTAAASIPFWKLPLWRFGSALAALLVIAFIIFRLFFQSDRTEFQPTHELAQNSLGETPLRAPNEPPGPNAAALALVSPTTDAAPQEEVKPVASGETEATARAIAATPKPSATSEGQPVTIAKKQASPERAGAPAAVRMDSVQTDSQTAVQSLAAPPPAATFANDANAANVAAPNKPVARPLLLAGAAGGEPSGTAIRLAANSSPVTTSVPTVTEAAPAEVHSQSFVRFATAQQEKARDERLPQFPVPPLLQSFKVEQNGLNLRVIDADGSIYRGMFDEANTIYGQVSARRTRDLAVANRNRFRSPSPKAGAELTRREPVIYFYQVSGTNLTRKATLTFSWNFVSTNEVTLAAMPDYRPVIKDADFSKQISDFPELLHRSYLKGRVQFDDGRVTEINAAPVK